MLDILEFNSTHNTPSELMVAVQELSENQVRTLALDLIWKMALPRRDKGRLNAKRAILEAKMRPEFITK